MSTDQSAVSTRYRVRKQSSGRAASYTYYVWDTVAKGRVTVNAHRVPEGAQADADSLNISDMIRPHAEDPRPYEERRAEAESVYFAWVAGGRK